MGDVELLSTANAERITIEIASHRFDTETGLAKKSQVYLLNH